jgi:pimeloyl-ACP methyl ester carboxylesterase
VLTPCDAFEHFPPKPFDQLPRLARVPGAVAAFLQPTRIGALHNTPLVYGLLTRRPIPRELTEAWLAPARTDAGVRRDLTKVLRGIDPRHTLEAAARLRAFDRPVLLAWAADDRIFKRALGERLAAVFPDARLELVEDTGTFVPLDRPDRLAELLWSFAREPAVA